MAKVLFKEYLWLIAQLAKEDKTFAELQESWRYRLEYDDDQRELAEKTFYNWRQKIPGTFGAIIERVPGTQKYTITNRHSLFKDDATRWLLQSMAISNAVAESKNMRDRVILEHVPSGEVWLEDIMRALQNTKVIEMQYTKFGQERSNHNFKVAPLGLKMHERRWYLLANDLSETAHNDEKLSKWDKFGVIKVYALDRIDRLWVLPETFKYPKGFSTRAYFAEFYGVWANYTTPLERVLIEVPYWQIPYVDNLPFHPSQKKIEENEKTAIYELRLRPEPDFMRAMLYQGIDVKVIEPQWLHDRMAEWTAQMGCMYNPDSFETDEE